jgi:CheY-like chemotaxis protein
MMIDLMMPDIDGVDLISALDTRDAWRSIPVVINSAVSDHDHVRSLKGSRVREYLLKPFNPQIAIPRLERILRSLPAASHTPAAPHRDSNGIPVVLARGEDEDGAGEEMRRAVPDSYDLSEVRTGPALLVAAVELRPWTVFVRPDVGLWPLAKTMRTVMALKAGGKIRTIPLPKSDDAGTALAVFKRELARGPFELKVAEGEVTVLVSESFTPTCIRALMRDLGAVGATGVERITMDIPYHSIQRGALLALQGLIQNLRGDG